MTAETRTSLRDQLIASSKIYGQSLTFDAVLCNTQDVKNDPTQQDKYSRLMQRQHIHTYVFCGSCLLRLQYAASASIMSPIVYPQVYESIKTARPASVLGIASQYAVPFRPSRGHRSFAPKTRRLSTNWRIPPKPGYTNLALVSLFL